MILPRSFYFGDSRDVARNLLGQILVRETEEGVASGIIVETEAYLGTRDDAAHSYKGKTERVRALYGEKGTAYIYLIYGMYYCLNIASGPDGEPECVLIRALQPLEGMDIMARRRGTARFDNLCSGPGKLCQALAIDKSLYGADVTQKGPLYIVKGAAPEKIEATPRVGIDYAFHTKDALWRFIVAGNAFVSGAKKKRALQNSPQTIDENAKLL
ncbi:MAG: DNA-3-methyladenine glycosylase [Clostridiales bacterium]|nr:DNA-3-methyladenine glycosylase [Clostridiales bacterium]